MLDTQRYRKTFAIRIDIDKRQVSNGGEYMALLESLPQMKRFLIGLMLTVSPSTFNIQHDNCDLLNGHGWRNEKSEGMIIVTCHVTKYRLLLNSLWLLRPTLIFIRFLLMGVSNGLL